MPHYSAAAATNTLSTIDTILQKDGREWNTHKH